MNRRERERLMSNGGGIRRLDESVSLGLFSIHYLRKAGQMNRDSGPIGARISICTAVLCVMWT